MSADGRTSRRTFGKGVLAAPFFGSLTTTSSASARSRAPLSGKITLRVPWALSAFDPHALDDSGAAAFGDALFDGLYAANGAPVLAAGPPEVDGDTLKVSLRQGLTTARGRPFEIADVVFALSRARQAGARAWLSDVPPPRVVAGALVFAFRDPVRLTTALASPLVAMVPRSFAPTAPDGTGPFRADKTNEGFVFVRNERAANGPSFLDRIEVSRAYDLAASLRAFESGKDDLGWLGAGLHEPRPGAKSFDVGAVGYVVLRTGREAAGWDAPGVGQRLADGLSPSRVAHLALGSAWPVEGDGAWGGAPGTVLVREDFPHLVEVARIFAGSASRPSHELTVRPSSPDEIADRLRRRNFVLMVDFVRPFAFSPAGIGSALVAGEDHGRAADFVRRPQSLSPRVLTRSMRVGVLGELRVTGARMPDVSLPLHSRGAGIDWGSITRGRAR